MGETLALRGIRKPHKERIELHFYGEWGKGMGTELGDKIVPQTILSSPRN